MTNFPAPKFIAVNGTQLAIYEAGNPSATSPPVVLVHGWPEIAYSWKTQMPALADAGFRVIAPDLKGFGRSNAPKDPSLYDIRHLTDDLAALLDALEIEKAIFCGHDWGGAIVWPMAQLHPDRVVGVASICTPHRKPALIEPVSIMKQRFTEQHYIVRFQEPERPEEILESDIDRFFRLTFRHPPKREDWVKLGPQIFDLLGRLQNGPSPMKSDLVLSEEDLDVYVKAYQRSGFHGGVNLYRNIDRNWRLMKDIDPVINHPALWVGAELDLFLPIEAGDQLTEIVPNVEKKLIADCGHWVMWERPEALSAILVDWLNQFK